MEKEQLEKKVQWLDEERRKAQTALAEIEKRMAAIERSASNQQVKGKTVTTQGNRLELVAKQIADLETELKTLRAENKKQALEFEKALKLQEKQFQQEQRGVSKALDEFRKEGGSLQSLQTNITTQQVELGNLRKNVQDLGISAEKVSEGEELRAKLAKKLEETSKEDAKRLTEMHAEVASLLSRLEAAADKTENVLLSQRKVEKKMDEFTAADAERRLEQKKFLETAALDQADRDRVWKEWQQRFKTVEDQSAEISARLKDIETTDLAVKRAQRSFDELSEKITRRMNELTEVQRLGDQRFRQEWSTFQADTQKRWASFTLSHEEQQREAVRQREKLADQLAQLEDSLREVQDGLQHFSDQSERNLQALLELARDSLAENERFVSNQR